MKPPAVRWKPDAEAIAAFFNDLARADWLSPRRAGWPRKLVHVTDITNAVRIIQDGCLVSRRRAIQEGRLARDSASRSHIFGTSAFVLDYVRLYFRPRTQTFEINEGFLPRIAEKIEGAQMPIPVAFLFDAEAVLALEGVLFSDGNLARSRKYLRDDVAFLEQLPFHFVYRDPALIYDVRLDDYPPDHRDGIKNYQHAEVIVPDSLSLYWLLDVRVRSEAERETLLSLVPGGVDFVMDVCGGTPVSVDGEGTCFFHKSVYVKSVRRERHAIHVTFNTKVKHTGPFAATFQLIEPVSGHVLDRRVSSAFFAGRECFHPLPTDYWGSSRPLLFRLDLDGHVACLVAI